MEHARTHEPCAIRAVPFLAALLCTFGLNRAHRNPRSTHVRPQREP